MRNEPAVKVATITALVSAALTLGTSFGLHMSADQTAAILGFVGIAAPLVAGLITRSQVTPKARPEHKA